MTVRSGALVSERALAILTAATLGLALIFGGGTRQGFLGDMFPQAAGLLLLTGYTLSLGREGSAPVGWLTWTLVLVLPVLGFLQASLSLVGAELDRFVGPAEALSSLQSMRPNATLAAVSSLIAPVAVFLALTQLGLDVRIALIQLMLALGIISLGVGFLQVAQGPESPLRLFAHTNPTEAVGFFANRNHFASWLLVMLVATGAWLAMVTATMLRGRVSASRVTLEYAAALALTVALMTGLALARSRAGVALAILAVVGMLFLVLMVWGRLAPTQRGRGRSWGWLLLGVAFAVSVALGLGLQRVLSRFSRDPLEDLRVALNVTTLEGVVAALPLGSGLGTFIPAYAALERTDDLFRGFANRAHNDWLEFALEGGLPAIVIITLFLVWLALRLRDLAHVKDGTMVLIQGSAALAVVLVLLHSIVDYPLRTTAMATVFALACGLLTRPPASATRHDARPARQPKPRSMRAPPAQSSAPAPAMRQPKPDRAWPKAWTRMTGEASQTLPEGYSNAPKRTTRDPQD